MLLSGISKMLLPKLHAWLSPIILYTKADNLEEERGTLSAGFTEAPAKIVMISETKSGIQAIYRLTLILHQDITLVICHEKRKLNNS